MLKDESLYFYNMGYNCSQCILKACERVYKINIPKQCIDMCSAVNTGFGVGGMCSILVSGIMVFGLLFDEDTAKRLRIEFLSEFQSKHHSINCSDLKNERKQGLHCEELVMDIAELIQKTVEKEKMSK